MPRRPRLQFPGAVYHVMSRGNRKAAIFDDDVDRRYFLQAVSDTATRYRVRVYAGCLMRNHYHLLFDTPRGNLSEAMRQLNGLYSQTCNQRHNRSGHTFEARFHSIVVQRETYLRRAARYVVANPVNAGLCGSPSDWPWSTYRATAGLESPPAWLYVDWIEWAFHADSRREAQQKYRRFVEATPATGSTIDLEATVLGTDSYQQAAQALSDRYRLARRLPDTATELSPPALPTVFAALSSGGHECGEFIYVAHVTYGYSLTEIAAFLRLNPGTVSRAFQRSARGRR